jgi:methenyltetrahydromethanopterin cyclohydrolase
VWISSLESGATYHGGKIDMALLDAQWSGTLPATAVSGAAQP